MENHEYKCAVCGTWHKDIISRAQCEIACTEKKAEEERKAAEAKKKAEYETRVAEVDAAFDSAYELRDKLLEDYGSYVYKRVTKNSDRYFPFSWLWE
jgi:hypothetical protein